MAKRLTSVPAELVTIAVVAELSELAEYAAVAEAVSRRTLATAIDAVRTRDPADPDWQAVRWEMMAEASRLVEEARGRR